MKRISVAYQQVCDEDSDDAITFKCNMVLDSYGVPGSPVWYSPSNIVVVNVCIEDQTGSWDQMVEKFGEERLNQLYDRLYENIDNGDWDIDEPDWELGYG